MFRFGQNILKVVKDSLTYKEHKQIIDCLAIKKKKNCNIIQLCAFSI